MNTPAILVGMNKLRVLTVTFDTEIPPWRIREFRAAIASKVGLENEWFHNHDNDGQAPKHYEKLADRKYHYRYPKIQYKVKDNRPMIVFLAECVEEAHKFFSQPDWSLRIAGEHHDMKIDRLDMREFNMQIWERDFQYRLYKWQALNSKNYEIYQQLDSNKERCDFLEGLLVGHILSFARGIDWHLEKRLEVNIANIIRTKHVSYKRLKVLCFDVAFTTNMFLPQYLGLGKGCSKGFGVVRTIGKPKNNQK